MFAVSIVIAIIIGYLFKGKLSNIGELNYKGLWFVIIGFGLEAIMKVLLAKGLLEIGAITFVVNVIMYSLIMTFIFLNRKDKFILAVGLGFILNIIVIFANGCIMPVGAKAAEILNFSGEVSNLGLYAMVDSNTAFVLLADIIPYKVGPLNGIASVGDIFISMGIMGIVIRGMRENHNSKYKKYELKY